MDPKDTLLKWLQDAYAMETGTIPMLENQSESAREYPALQAKMREHLQRTKSHADAIRQAIERRGGDPSALKSGAAAAVGWIEGMVSTLNDDQIIKNSIGNYATEQFEIAVYTALIAAAEAVGDTETIDACEKILADEEEMAAWLADQLPDTVAEFLRRRAP